ncbi:MAG TPA: hypothetical protein VHT28_02500 [Silvibacterium sp.]|jgi:hypothetical protein|nr:hypothetical protein [Silvibacterium sp.]
MLKRKITTLAFAVALAAASFAGAEAFGAPQAAPADDQHHVITMVNVMASVEKGVDTKKAKTGDPVTARTTAATALSDGTQVPAGSILAGHIDSVTPSEKKSDATLVLTFDKLQIKNGKEIPIKATIASITSTTPAFSEDKPYDPSSYRPGTQGDNKANGENNQGSGSTAPHPIEGLTFSGSPKDSFSATLTQAKKNLQLSSSTHLVVSVAAVP